MELPTPEKLSLANLYGGAAIERFDRELQRALDNLQDINTTAGARKITLTVAVKPLDENRHTVGITIDCKSTLCGDQAITSTGLMKLDEKGRAFVEEVVPNANQPALPGFGNVKPFQAAGKGAE
jgi:hypothetical protein